MKKLWLETGNTAKKIQAGCNHPGITRACTCWSQLAGFQNQIRSLAGNWEIRFKAVVGMAIHG